MMNNGFIFSFASSAGARGGERAAQAARGAVQVPRRRLREAGEPRAEDRRGARAEAPGPPRLRRGISLRFIAQNDRLIHFLMNVLSEKFRERQLKLVTSLIFFAN